MKLKSLILLLLAFTMITTVKSQETIKLSQTAKISLLTCGPGQAVYSKYGHSALWVFDPGRGIDRVYNYGTFDFYSNKFYFEFIRGTAMYNLSVTNFLNFRNEYISENRFIKEQELNLSPAEKQDLFHKLEVNYLPENRYYRYDFLFQNCSSLIRDIVWEVTSNKFTIPERSEEKHTYRSMMVPYLSGDPWLFNGIFILLGHKSDLEADPWNQMYLPDYMFYWFDAATNHEGESLVSKTHSLFMPLPEGERDLFLLRPGVLLSFILIIVLFLSIYETRKNRSFKLIDFLVFFITGLLGILLLYMWLYSEHEVTHQNINLLWAFPLHFVFAIAIFFKGLRRPVRIYSRVMVFATGFYICFFWLLPQTVPVSAVLASVLVFIRLLKAAGFDAIEKLSKKV